MKGKEQLHHRQAYEAWVALGEGRSFAKLAKATGGSKPTLARWATTFGWEERLKKREEADKDRVSRSLTIAKDNDAVKEVETLIGRVSSVIESCFKFDAEEKLQPTFQIETVLDFTRVVEVQKDLILLHKELTELPLPGRGGKKVTMDKLAETLNVFMGNATDEQKLSLLKPGQGEKGRAGGDTGTISDADFTEVSDGADSEKD